MFRDIPVLNCNKSQVIDAVEPLVQVKSSMSETATLTQPTTTCQLTNQNKKSVANNYLHSAVCNTIVIDNKQYQLVKDSSGQLRAVFMPTISNSPSIQGTATITTCQSVNEPSGQMRAVDNGTLISVISPPTVFIRVCKMHQYKFFYKRLTIHFNNSESASLNFN